MAHDLELMDSKECPSRGNKQKYGL